MSDIKYMVSHNLDKNIEIIKKLLPVDTSFDILTRDLFFGDTRVFYIGIDGLTKDEALTLILGNMQNNSFSKDTIINDVKRYISSKNAYIELDETVDIEKIISMVLCGASALFVDGFNLGIILDTRTYPVRSIDEPDNERVTQGAKDGFVETIVFNTALIRRRIRDSRLTFEMNTVGEKSKTDVVVGYIKGTINEELLNTLITRIQNTKTDALNNGARTLEELIVKRKWYCPLPTVRYTERPDVACSHLLEGHICVIVDNSPTVMIFPCTIFQFTQSPEDYYQNAVTGTYIRLIRLFCVITSLLLMPTFLVLGIYNDRLPDQIKLLTQTDIGRVKLFIFVLIIELGLDIFKYTSSNASSGLSHSISLIGGLIIGEMAIKLNWIATEPLFYGAITLLASVAIANQEFSSGVRIYRLFLVFATGFFGIWGFIIGLLLVFISILLTKSIGRESYLWPLIPLNWKELKGVIIRKPTSKAQGSLNKK